MRRRKPSRNRKQAEREARERAALEQFQEGARPMKRKDVSHGFGAPPTTLAEIMKAKGIKFNE